MFKNTFFLEYLWATASVHSIYILSWNHLLTQIDWFDTVKSYDAYFWYNIFDKLISIPMTTKK